MARVFADILRSNLPDPATLLERIDAYEARLEHAATDLEFVDLATARTVARRCKRLLGSVGPETREEQRRLVCATANYFLLRADADHDEHSPIGFDDDARVVELTIELLGLAHLFEAEGEPR